ncbi:hypothetical protein [Novosphingobium sp.]|uniref:hypothetical protein n=1 Tax=Novosphingobium sp. TaxID=1874826 RepID=UPI0038BDF743
MDLDDQMRRYFGTSSPEALSPPMLEIGMERLAVDFGLETDRGRRFAMWAVMHILGNAPELDVAFKNPADRDAARNFMDMVARSEG